MTEERISLRCQKVPPFDLSPDENARRLVSVHSCVPHKAASDFAAAAAAAAGAAAAAAAGAAAVPQLCYPGSKQRKLCSKRHGQP